MYYIHVKHIIHISSHFYQTIYEAAIMYKLIQKSIHDHIYLYSLFEKDNETLDISWRGLKIYFSIVIAMPYGRFLFFLDLCLYILYRNCIGVFNLSLIFLFFFVPHYYIVEN